MNPDDDRLRAIEQMAEAQVRENEGIPFRYGREGRCHRILAKQFRLTEVQAQKYYWKAFLCYSENKGKLLPKARNV